MSGVRARRPSLLFLSPVVPDPAGIGLARRAALFVVALARRHRVFLHVLPVFGRVHAGTVWPLAALYADAAIEPLEHLEDPLFRMVRGLRDVRHRLAAAIAYPRPQLCRFEAARLAEELADRYPAIEVVHVFRLYLAPFAAPFLERKGDTRPVCRLDLDDDEVETHARFAELARRGGREAEGRFEQAEAAKYGDLEQAFLSRFDAVFLAGEQGRARLAARVPGSAFHEAPNAVPLPAFIPARRADGPQTILFLATLNYAPNEDAARFFCKAVLPLIRARRKEPIRFLISGRSPGPTVWALAAMPDVEVRANVPEVGPLYAEADLVVAPLRAGGGTRIKILEAFAYRRPVVATTLGIEGIVAQDGRHVLIRDAPEDIAAACVHLLDSPDARARTAEQALALVRATYADGPVMDRIEHLTLPPRRTSPAAWA